MAVFVFRMKGLALLICRAVATRADDVLALRLPGRAKPHRHAGERIELRPWCELAAEARRLDPGLRFGGGGEKKTGALVCCRLAPQKRELVWELPAGTAHDDYVPPVPAGESVTGLD